MKYLLHAIVTIITGIVFFFIGELIYTGIIENKIAPLTMPVYFLCFMVILIIVLWLLSIKRGKYLEARDKKNESGRFKLIIVVSLVLLVLLTGLFEFLYELGGKNISLEPTSYVFIIDDSGSMKTNDSKGVRKDSINDIVNELNTDLPYAVYLFSDGCSCVKTMSNSTECSFSLRSSGGTNIVGALKYVYKDYNNDSAGWGEAPKVLLLTDGEASRFGLKSIIKKYRKSRISVSAVGFGSADSSYLTTIANNTGGVFVDSDHISNLKSSMEKAIKTYSLENRNLLSDRFCENDGLYTFLRILFLVILSVIIAVIKANAMFDTDRWPLFLFLSVIFGVLASILMEVLISHAYVSIKPVHFICCILWAFVPASIESGKKGNKPRYQPIDFDNYDSDGSYDDSQNTVDRNLDEYDDSENRIDL